MKKKLILGLSALLCVSIASCDNSNGSNESTSSIKESAAIEESSTNDFEQNETFVPEESTTPSNNYKPLEGDLLSIHYYRYDGNYSNWALWLWETGKNGAEFQFNSTDDYGAVATYALAEWTDVVTNGLGFIVKTKGSWDSKDVENDRFIDFSLFEKDKNW